MAELLTVSARGVLHTEITSTKSWEKFTYDSSIKGTKIMPKNVKRLKMMEPQNKWLPIRNVSRFRLWVTMALNT